MSDLIDKARHREIVAEFQTARHDRAIIAQALQFLLAWGYDCADTKTAALRAVELIHKLDAVALQEIEPPPPKPAAPEGTWATEGQQPEPEGGDA